MPRTVLAAALLSAFAALAAHAADEKPAVPAASVAKAPLLEPGKKLALCGDSITSSGLYPSYLEAYLLVCAPTPGAEILNFGRWGETAHQFPPTMDGAVAAKPDVVSICYGMNSCRSGKVIGEGAVAAHNADLKAIVEKFRAGGCTRFVLCSPGCVDSTHFTLSQSKPPEPGPIEATQKNLTLLRDGAEKLAKELGVVFCDVNTPMKEVMAKAKERHGAAFAFAGGGGDGVHPGGAGHLVMAWAILKALGFDGHIGTVTVDLAKNAAEAGEGHQVLSCAAGVVELESARWPFCFGGKPGDARAPRSVCDLFPFNADLNRFTLVVKGAAGKRWNVTWGAQSVAFDGAELEKGVNLAEKFLDNPFCAPFEKVLFSLGERNNCRRWLQKEYKGDKGMEQRLQKALDGLKPAPVKHTLKIEEAK